MKVFKYEYSYGEGGAFFDYITLTYDGDSIIKGLYYGHTKNLSENLFFMANIKFESSKKDSIVFYLTDYKFSKDPIIPSSKPHYYALDELPMDLQGEVKFYGRANGQKLLLDRTIWYYDSKLDRMIFDLEK